MLSYRDQINKFWKDCVDDGFQVDVGDREKGHVDRRKWEYVPHATIVKKPAPNGTLGYEAQVRRIETRILYKDGRKYCWTRIVQDLSKFMPETR